MIAFWSFYSPFAAEYLMWNLVYTEWVTSQDDFLVGACFFSHKVAIFIIKKI